MLTHPKGSVATGAITQDGLFNYFRYAEEELAYFDSNADGLLDQAEVKAIFGEEQGQRYFAAVSGADGTKESISPEDMASFLLAQDASADVFANPAFIPESDGTEETETQRKILIGIKEQFELSQEHYKNYYAEFYPDEVLPEMKLDGQATAAERHALDIVIQDDRFNMLVGRNLSDIHNGLGLSDQYQDYLNAKEGGESA